MKKIISSISLIGVIGIFNISTTSADLNCLNKSEANLNQTVKTQIESIIDWFIDKFETKNWDKTIEKLEALSKSLWIMINKNPSPIDETKLPIADYIKWEIDSYICESKIVNINNNSETMSDNKQELNNSEKEYKNSEYRVYSLWTSKRVTFVRDDYLMYRVEVFDNEMNLKSNDITNSTTVSIWSLNMEEWDILYIVWYGTSWNIIEKTLIDLDN